MLATIRDNTWNVLNMQHTTPNSKRWDYSDIPGGAHKKIRYSMSLINHSDKICVNTFFYQWSEYTGDWWL